MEKRGRKHHLVSYSHKSTGRNLETKLSSPYLVGFADQCKYVGRLEQHWGMHLQGEDLWILDAAWMHTWRCISVTTTKQQTWFWINTDCWLNFWTNSNKLIQHTSADLHPHEYDQLAGAIRWSRRRIPPALNQYQAWQYGSYELLCRHCPPGANTLVSGYITNTYLQKSGTIRQPIVFSKNSGEWAHTETPCPLDGIVPMQSSEIS